ncbi:MAG: type IX secretion system membrane protein PorP/SprF [Cytophagales bacterium]
MRRSLSHIAFLILLISGISKAQDYQFTQFYAAPLYLNPAFAGSSDWARANVLYRMQWPAAAAKFTTMYASFDQNIPQIRSGAGLLVSRDVQGSARLSTTSVMGQYAYRLNINRKWAFRAGAGVGYSWLSIDGSALTLRENIDNQTGSISNTAASLVNFENRRFFDVVAGGLLYSSKAWVGTSVRHINQPDMTVVTGGAQKLPLYLSVHGGYQIPLFPGMQYRKGADVRPSFISPAFHFKKQAKFMQLDLGAYYYYDFLTFGAWYRGIPVVKKETVTITNHDAFSILAGYRWKGLSIAYSYDITISPLSTLNTGGAHEISMIYEFEYAFNPIKGRPPKDQRLIPCPRF